MESLKEQGNPNKHKFYVLLYNFYDWQDVYAAFIAQLPNVRGLETLILKNILYIYF